MIFPLKLNINLDLDKTTQHHVIATNKTLNRDYNNEIDFSPPKSDIPHITLAMGNVECEKMYALIVGECEKLAAELAPISFKLSDPYNAPPDYRYVLLDVVDNNLIHELRRATSTTLKGLMNFTSHGGGCTKPHITAAYLGSSGPARITYDSTPPKKSTARSIRICRAGPRGTCTETLQSLPLLRVARNRYT